MSEADGVARYVTQEVLAEHSDWHMNHMDHTVRGYGRKFFSFHRKFIDKFDKWRRTHAYPPLVAWDPATPIPADLPHPGRITNFPDIPLPSWATAQGGAARDPVFGYRSLQEFKSDDELGRALDAPSASYHGTVHVAIGGDMANPERAPLDPVFWRYHKFIDQVRANWVKLHKKKEKKKRKRRG